MYNTERFNPKYNIGEVIIFVKYGMRAGIVEGVHPDGFYEVAIDRADRYGADRYGAHLERVPPQTIIGAVRDRDLVDGCYISLGIRPY